jgi:hypothetical protein
MKFNAFMNQTTKFIDDCDLKRERGVDVEVFGGKRLKD